MLHTYKKPPFFQESTGVSAKSSNPFHPSYANYSDDDFAKLYTADGQRRGYIETGQLTDFWIHMGTKCNLHCPTCFEGASKNSNRIESLNYEEAESLIFEALEVKAQKFCFTGGEPFVHDDFIKILDLALKYRPCLVLSNATAPIEKYMSELEAFTSKPHKLFIRVSIDYPYEEVHDAGRGKGSFQKALNNASKLASMGHHVSIARRKADDEDTSCIDSSYRKLFEQFNLPQNTNIVAFSDLLLDMHDHKNIEITEKCMTTYKNAQERDNFMCAHCLMVTKKKGELCFYPCTLVDDDDSYILGDSLTSAYKKSKIILRHPRCFTCFKFGTSCAEPAAK